MLYLTTLVLTFVISVSILSSAYAEPVNEFAVVSDASKMGNKVYEPNPLTIKQGDTVKWINKDFGLYTVTDNNGLFGSDDLGPDQTFEHTFVSSGTFDYHCEIHPSMTEKGVV